MEEWVYYNSPLRQFPGKEMQRSTSQAATTAQPKKSRNMYVSPSKCVERAIQDNASKQKYTSSDDSSRQVLYPLKYGNQNQEDTVSWQRDPLVSEASLLEVSSPPPPPASGTETLDSENEEVEALNREIMKCNRMYREGKETIQHMQMVDEKKAKQVEETKQTVQELQSLYHSLYTSLKDAATEIQKSTDGTLQAKSPVRKVADSVTSRLPENPHMIAETASGTKLTATGRTSGENGRNVPQYDLDTITEDNDEKQFEEIQSQQAKISSELSHSIDDLLDEARAMIVRRQNETSAKQDEVVTATTANTTLSNSLSTSFNHSLTSTGSQPTRRRSTSTVVMENDAPLSRDQAATTSRKDFHRASLPTSILSTDIQEEKKKPSSTSPETSSLPIQQTTFSVAISTDAVDSDNNSKAVSSTSTSQSHNEGTSTREAHSTKKSRANRIRSSKSGTQPETPPPGRVASYTDEVTSSTSHDESGQVGTHGQQRSRSNSIDSLSKQSSLLQQGIESPTIDRDMGNKKRKDSATKGSVYRISGSPTTKNLSTTSCVIADEISPLVLSSKVNALEEQSLGKRISEIITTDHKAVPRYDRSKRLPNLSIDSSKLVSITPTRACSERSGARSPSQSQQSTASTVARWRFSRSLGEYYWKAASSGNPSSLMLMQNGIWNNKRSSKGTEADASSFIDSPSPPRRETSRSVSPTKWKGYPRSRSKSKNKKETSRHKQPQSSARRNNSALVGAKKGETETESTHEAASPVRMAQRQWLERRIRNTNQTPAKNV